MLIMCPTPVSYRHAGGVTSTAAHTLASFIWCVHHLAGQTWVGPWSRLNTSQQYLCLHLFCNTHSLGPCTKLLGVTSVSDWHVRSCGGWYTPAVCGAPASIRWQSGVAAVDFVFLSDQVSTLAITIHFLPFSLHCRDFLGQSVSVM